MRQRVVITLVLTVTILLTVGSLAFAQPLGQLSYLPVVVTPPETPSPGSPVPSQTATATATTTATATETATATATTTATPTVEAGEVRVASSRGFLSTFGTSYYVVGEVVNETPDTVYSVKVIARFYDAANQLIATDDTFTFFSAVFPNQRSPFRVLLFDPPSDIARYELTLDVSDTSFLEYRNVEVLSQSTRDTSIGVEVFGEVRNNRSQIMNSVEVVVTFYDADLNVIDVDNGFPSVTTLDPGETSVYSLSTLTENTFSSFVVQAQGYIAP